jgi:hypothetical protein
VNSRKYLCLVAIWVAGAGMCQAQSAHCRHRKTIMLKDLEVTPGTARTATTTETIGPSRLLGLRLKTGLGLCPVHP